MLLEEQELQDIVEKTVTLPTDAVLLAKFKAKRIILDVVKDDIILHVVGKVNAFHMWESLSNLYQSSNWNRKMMLREKLNGLKMTKTEIMALYLMRISQSRDELADVGETVTSAALARIALKGFGKPWEQFVQGIVARETMPSWERLCDDFIQEEMRKDLSSTSQHHVGDDEENVALFTKGMKKAKKSGPKGGSKGGAKKLK